MSYVDDVREDTKQYILDEYDASDFEGLSKDKIYERLNDDLWIADSVTGNASGSYTFNTLKAKDIVLSNIEEVSEAYEEFGQAEEFGKDIQEGEWESLMCQQDAGLWDRP